MQSDVNYQITWFWAKLGRNTWPDAFHPVICHLIDVGAVARELWNSSIRDTVKQSIATHLGLEVDKAGAWIAFWVAAHDIGKITPGFQFRDNSTELKRRLAVLDFDNGTGDPDHTDSGTKVLYDALVNGGDGAWPKFDPSLAHKIAVTIGGHHGVFPTNWKESSSRLGQKKWPSVRKEMLDHLARLFGVKSLPVPKLTAPDDQSVWMVLAGLTSVADWIGSNIDVFNFVGDGVMTGKPFDVDAYFTKSVGKARDALERFGWLHHAGGDRNPRTFQEATGIEDAPRPLQVEIAKIANAMKKEAPQLIIVEAPMGEGKTEAAWYVADCWNRMGGAGTYVALPTMATSNQMFSRVETFLKLDGGPHHLQLLHGKASLNPNFERLNYRAELYDSGKKPSGVVAEEWFAQNKKQALLAPFGVGTIDQVLMAVLQTKHVFVRLFGLAGKCVILDEVHAYDAYMTALMARLLRWLAALGCPVVLLSATLPKAKRLELMRAYAGNDNLDFSSNIPYPRVTTVGVRGKDVCEVQVMADASRKKTIHLGWLAPDDLATKLRESLKDGGCAAVIRNTVGLAQETYTNLKAAFDAEIKAKKITVELFHARFPFGRRQEIETAVLEKYGKGPNDPANPKRPAKAILVATQVIEQSLDLDFDVMISDIAPVDLVLQRAGRLHRHERGKRPEPLQDPKLWLIEPGEKEGRPDFGASEWVYDLHSLLRSYLVLCDKRSVTLPTEIDGLINEVYSDKIPDGPESWGDALVTSKSKQLAEQKEDKKAATQFLIACPIDEDDILERFNRELQDSDDPRVPKERRAMTRLTEQSVQVIFIYETPDGLSLDVEGKHPVDLHKAPKFSEIADYLLNSVSLNHRPTVEYYCQRDTPSKWLGVGMLRFYRVVRLAVDGNSIETEFPMINHHELGVRFTRDEDSLR